VIRGSIAMSVAFIWGVAGHSKTGRHYDPGAAICVALMLRKCISSSSMLNAQRMRGVAIGTVVGQAVYATVGWCTLWGYAISSMALLGWVGVSFFQHHDASRIGSGLRVGSTTGGPTAGLLSAYFCARGILQPCVGEVLTLRDALGANYYSIINALAAVFVCCVVDHTVETETTCQLAGRVLYFAMRGINDATSKILNPQIQEVHIFAAHSSRALRIAHAMGHQTQQEPRYWRTPWKGALYRDAVQSAARLRMAFVGMECVAIEGGRYGTSKVEGIRRLTSLPSFQALRQITEENLEHIKVLIDAALMQDTGEVSVAYQAPQLKRAFGVEFLDAMRAFVRDANAQPELLHDRMAGISVESDPASQACVLLSCLAAMIREAQALQTAVLNRAW